MREDLARLWHRRAKLNRADVFGSADIKLRPTAMPSQVDICVPGMVGPAYQAGGLAIVSVNPAGGRDGFRPTPGDDALYAAAHELRSQGTLEVFERLNAAFMKGMPSWGPQWRVISDILGATRSDIRALAYPYLVPFRSRGDAGSRLPQPVLDAGYRNGFAEIISVLRPAMLIPVDRPSEAACIRAIDETGLECEVVYFTRKRDAHAERKSTLAVLATMKSGSLA